MRKIKFEIQNNQFIINSICIPDFNSEQSGEAFVTGCGITSFEKGIDPSFLNEIKLPILSREKCRRIWDASPQSYKHKAMINDRKTCTTAITPPTCFAPDDKIIPNIVIQNNIEFDKIWNGIFSTISFSHGDSGSPLIHYYNGRATAIGIVSGGGYLTSSNPTQILHSNI